MYVTLFFSMLLCATVKTSKMAARLPPQIIPSVYDLFIEPHLLEGTFNGLVYIDFILTEPGLTSIPIHQDDLLILFTNLTGPMGSLNISRAYYDKIDQFYVMEVEEPLPKGNYTLGLNFAGSMLGKLEGLYRSSYKMAGNDSKEHLMAVTKFEPTNARKAFPCFDEPHLKAQFYIKVVKPADQSYSAFSNSPVKDIVELEGSCDLVVEFEPTPVMSTYLVAFVVADYKSLGVTFVNNLGVAKLPIQVLAPPDQLNKTKFAVTVVEDVLPYFVKYFGNPFPLPKLDLISVPDFPSGAMENWGLVTFKPTRLLVEADGSLRDQRKVAATISHEIAHNWFGNLVTMKWWNDLWLNEGFARFMQIKGTNEGFRDGGRYKKDNYGMHDIKIQAMALDSSTYSHRLSQPVDNPADIDAIFDTISYGKGASILHMVEKTIGENAFQRGIQNYVKNALYSNAEEADLWEALDRASEVGDLAERMATWTGQMGYPFLFVERYNEKLILTQERFTDDIESTWWKNESVHEYKWSIPICYTSDRVSNEEWTFLFPEDKSYSIPIEEHNKWIKFNCDGFGYYRVMYDPITYNAIIKQLVTNHTVFSDDDRANLLDDAFALANAGYLDFETPLKMVRYLSKERSRLPLEIAFHHLLNIISKVDSAEKEKLQTLIVPFVEEIYQSELQNITWDFTIRQITSETQLFIMNIACRLKLDLCLTPITTYFKKWVAAENVSITPDFRTLVYSTGMALAGTPSDWEKVREKLNAAFDPLEREELIRSLCKIKDKNYKLQFLTDALHNGTVADEDFLRVLTKVGSKLAWDFYKENYLNIIEKVGKTNRKLPRTIIGLTKSFDTPLLLKEVKDLLKKHPQSGPMDVAERIITYNIENNMRWNCFRKPAVEFHLRTRENRKMPQHNRRSHMMRKTALTKRRYRGRYDY